MCSIGKLGIANPSALALELTEVLYTWCKTMKFSTDSTDKYNSFIGITQALMLNIKALDHSFQYFAESIIDYKEMPSDLMALIKQLLDHVKNQAGDGWESYVSKLPIRQELLANFQV